MEQVTFKSLEEQNGENSVDNSGNSVDNSGNSVHNPMPQMHSYPQIPSQLTGPVFVSFPPPPCAPSPLDTQQQLINGLQELGSSQVTRRIDHLANGGSATTANQQFYIDNGGEKVSHMSEAFATTLKIDESGSSDARISRPQSVESSSAILDCPQGHPYSVLLPPGTFVQRLGGNVPSQIYQQFSPVLAPTMPQFHTVYPVNIIQRDPTHGSATYLPARHVITPDCGVQETQGHSIPSTAVYASNIQEGAWSVHPAAVANPPPLYWGHYMPGADKSHGIPLTSQPFIRRHSICDESVVTPTNVCPPCNITGIVSATPEFIHPRKPDVPQWLMSPPVGEQDPSIISYAPMMYHNVRVPSVTGIAFPVGPPMNRVEPHKIDSPALVLSPLPGYENIPQPQNADGNTDPALGPQEVFADPSMQINSQHPPMNAFDQPLKLMTPGDFSLNTPDSSSLSSNKDQYPSCSKVLLTPSDFDSGYSTSDGDNKHLPCNSTSSESTGGTFVECFSCPSVDISTLIPDVRKSNQRNPERGIIANPKCAAEKRLEDEDAVSEKTANHRKQNCAIGRTNVPMTRTNRSSQKKCGAAKREEIVQHSSRRNNERSLHHTCPRHVTDNSNTVSALLLNAVTNLTAATSLLLKERRPVCSNRHSGCHKKGVRGYNGGLCVCALKGLAGPPLFKRIVELQQQPQCWQCVLSEKTPDVKHPTPDVYNRWPNIPPPPAPSEENDTCRIATDAVQLAAETLPLAAALFQSDVNECCSNGTANGEDDMQLPQTYPIGVFWDIENCAVPTGKSALSIVKRVRERFFAGHKEAEFMCVCDINKESRHVIQDLNNAQVNVVHISAIAKNAADDKLRQSIRRFAHNHPAPATLVLITGDSNFTAEVSDLRHRHKYFVVLIHPSSANSALLQAATTVIGYEQLVGDLPVVHTSPKDAKEQRQSQLLVSNLPRDNDANAIRNRLRQLSDNCGGKVVKLSSGTAILKFANAEATNRALKRLEGEDVFGHKITISVLQQSPNRPFVYHNKYNNNAQTFSPRRPNGNQENGMENQNGEIVTHASSGQPLPAGPDQQSHPTVNLTPGHCDPAMNMRPRFQPHYAAMTPVTTPFPVLPPNMHPCPVSLFNHNPPLHFPTHGYNSMPPPPQPQLFQPPIQYRKEENQQIGVKLTISNIDAQLGISSIQDIVLKHITGHCQVLNMKIRPHNRFTVVCDVIVPRVRDASRVLQHLQRQKIGNKRVLVTLTQQFGEESGSEDGISLRRECFSILKDCGERGMPLFKFLNVFEKRFQHKIKLMELRQIPDVVQLREGASGKEVFLHPSVSNEQSFEQHLAAYPRSGRSTPDINHDFLLPVCKLHYPPDAPRPPSVERPGGLLKIEMGLREFSAKLHALLHSHNGILQLDGFEYCYRAEYGNFPAPSDIHDGGVIVEHQASYVPGVQIITSQPHCLGVKAIVWAQPQSDAGSDTASDTSGASRWKSPNLIQFSREVVELLKDRPYCCLPYENFNPAYNRCFGHACRVSEYGFTRLSDLLTAIPHVLQIMGSLSNRILTLTHRAQVKRFTQEVVKILKSTPDRAILVAQMPELYNRMFNKAWRLRDYGVSVLSDLLDDIPEGHICTIGEGDNVVLSLPVRERTVEEKERTNQFAREVIKILRSRPHYRMPFTDFVPTYHRQFGRQCKLANYGFTKLIDLFEALPHVVEVMEKGSEKLLTLTDTERQKILSMQITSILRAQQPSKMLPQVVEHMRKTNPDGPTLPLACVPALFQQKYGFPLIPSEVGATDMDDLAQKLSHAVKVVINKTGDKMIRLSERKPLRLLSAQLLALLLDQANDQLDTEQLHSMYTERYKENIEPSEYGFLSFSDIIKKALPGVVKMDLDASECIIHLKPLYGEARAIRSILLKNNGTMTLGEFNFAYLTTNGCPVNCETYGFQSVESLLRALPNVLIVKGYGIKKTITLRNHMQCGPLTSAPESGAERGMCGSASMDSLQSFKSTSSRPPWLRNDHGPTLPKWASKHMASCLVTSASMGDFRSADEKLRRENISPGTFRQSRHANWIPPVRPAVPPFPGYHLPYATPSLRQPVPRSHFASMKSHSAGISPHKESPPACKFTLGGTLATSTQQIVDRTPVRRGISVSVITLPNGSTPIASTSSCSSVSTPRSVKSSFSSNSSSEYSSDEEESPAQNESARREKLSGMKRHVVSSLPNSPFSRIHGASSIGPMLVGSRHPHSEHGSPSRLHMAASFPTLA